MNCKIIEYGLTHIRHPANRILRLDNS